MTGVTSATGSLSTGAAFLAAGASGLGAALRFQPFEFGLSLGYVRHGGGYRSMAGLLGDEPMHGQGDTTVGRMALG